MAMNPHPSEGLKRTALAAALLAALAPLPALADPGPDAAGPASTISLGGAWVTDDNQRFGQFTGLTDEGRYGLLDADLVRLDPETGTWLRVTGRHWGLRDRSLSFSHERQGDWAYRLDYDQTPRRFPYRINTGLTGIGTNQLTTNAITPGAGTNRLLATERESLRAEVNKALAAGFGVRMNYKVEEKNGTRLYGRTGIDFLAEPIDYLTRQWEAVLSFTGERLQLAGGYYGTSFSDKYKALVVDGVTDGPNNVYSPIGLPPDNASHQLNLSGGYDFGRATRGNFKLAYGRITQRDDFIATVTTAPGIGTNLDGKIVSKQAQFGVTSRPTDRLNLLADFRYEDRDDRTPVHTYYTGASASSRTNGENEPRDHKTRAGKVEAGYRLPMDFRVTAGVDYEQKRRNVSPVRSVSVRQRTREITYRTEVRRSMSGTANGALAYLHGDRTGTPFETNYRNGGTLGANSIAPVHYADRRRDKVRFTLDWMPAEPLSVQVVADAAWDDYTARTAQNLGPRNGDLRHVSADAAYRVSEAWQVTAFASHDRSTTKQNSCDGISSSGGACAAADLWTARLVNRGYATGVGVRGRLGKRVTVGTDVQYSYDTGAYQQTGTPITVLADPVADLYYKQTTVNLFSDYAVSDRSGIGLNFIYDRRKTNDWSWVAWQYDDGTTLYQDPSENVVFVGANYHYAWR